MGRQEELRVGFAWSALGQHTTALQRAWAREHPGTEPGIVYRPVRDAPPVPVWLTWWRDDPPALAPALVRMAGELYGE